jgi:hypothetical protein
MTAVARDHGCPEAVASEVAGAGKPPEGSTAVIPVGDSDGVVSVMSNYS